MESGAQRIDPQTATEKEAFLLLSSIARVDINVNPDILVKLVSKLPVMIHEQLAQGLQPTAQEIADFVTSDWKYMDWLRRYEVAYFVGQVEQCRVTYDQMRSSKEAIDVARC